jgi:hypothetical protein
MHIVTLPRLKRALSSVINELTSFGFFDDKLSEIQVLLGTFGLAHGWQNYGSGGEITIPAISTSRLAQIFGWQTCCLTDVLRHEYAHAIADTHRGLFHSTVFANAFGNSHSSAQKFEYDPYYFVSEYAAKNTSESFAEVFMYFLKYKGNLSAIFDPPPIRRQWHFIKRLSTAMKQGKSRW